MDSFHFSSLKSAIKKDPSHILEMEEVMRGWWGRQCEKKMGKEGNDGRSSGPKGSCVNYILA